MVELFIISHVTCLVIKFSSYSQKGSLLLPNLPSEFDPFLDYGSHNTDTDNPDAKVLYGSDFPSIDGQLDTHVAQKSYASVNSTNFSDKESLQNQDSFGRWMNDIVVESPEEDENSILEHSLSPSNALSVYSVMGQTQSSFPDQIFTITDISPGWAFSTDNTKVSNIFLKEKKHKIQHLIVALICLVTINLNNLTYLI